MWKSSTGMSQMLTNVPWSPLAAFSPDNNWFAIVLERAVRLFDLRLRREIQSIKGSAGRAVTALAFSQDSAILAFAEGDGPDQPELRSKVRTVRIWDFRSNKVQNSLEATQQVVRLLAFGPAGETSLATASSAGEILAWDVMRGQLQERFQSHTNVASLALGLDGFLGPFRILRGIFCRLEVGASGQHACKSWTE